MRGDPTFWLLARAGGLTAYALLTAAMLAGLVVKARLLGRALKAAAGVDLHRFLTLLALGFIAVHGSSLLFDRTVHLSPAALLVPGLAQYRPFAVALEDYVQRTQRLGEYIRPGHHRTIRQARGRLIRCAISSRSPAPSGRSVT